MAFLGLATAVVTSSLIGADFSSGTMSNWLSYIPRRGQVFTSRLVIAVVAPLVLSAAILAADLAVFSFVVNAQGATGGLTGSGAVWATYGRGMVVIVFGAVLGTTVAFLTRRTIAAVGIILGYLIVKLIASGVFGFTPWFGHITPWFPENNALAVLMADYPYQINTETITANGAGYTSEEKVLPWEQGLVYLSVVAAGLITAALLTFRRRDQG